MLTDRRIQYKIYFSKSEEIQPGVFRISLLVCLLFVFLPLVAEAQSYDLLLKGGHMIDPKNSIDTPMDIAISGDKIAKVASDISADNAEKVIDIEGLLVTPGIIDIHGHLFHGTDDAYIANSTGSVAPDGFTFRAGVTTIVDAGSSGWKNFGLFKKQTIDQSQTRVLAFLNIVGVGMEGRLEEQNVMDMNPVQSAHMISREHPELIVGIKAAHYWGDFTQVEHALEAGGLANVPVMVDFGEHDPPLSLETLLMDKLRPGDMFTHTYSFTPGREEVVDGNFKVKPFIFEAQDRGILFDVGHGQGSLIWHQVIPSIQQGFYPDIISSDLHMWSMNHALKDMANLMSKFLNTDMTLEEVIIRSTWNPARYIGREDLGHLSEGAEADIAVFRLKEGNFGFLDSLKKTMIGTQKLSAELTLRGGRVVWDLNGIASPTWNKAEPQRYGW